MKNTMIALAAFGLVSFGSAAQAGDISAGQSVYANQACIGCHGAAGEGGVGPQLAGQAAADIIAKMHAYKNGEQVGPMTSMMAPMAAGLSDADIENIAAFTASL